MKLTVLILATFLASGTAGAEELVLSSPNGKIRITVSTGSGISLSVNSSSKRIFTVANISLSLKGTGVLGRNPAGLRPHRRSVDQLVHPQIREKAEVLSERFNELRMEFTGGYAIVLRSYDKGIAYRFVTSLAGEVIVENEGFSLSFSDSVAARYQHTTTFQSAYEIPYRRTEIGAIPREGFCCLPMLLEPRTGPKVLVTEADLEDYPGMWLAARGSVSLQPVFSGYPLGVSHDGELYGRGAVLKHADYIAKTAGTRALPWRVFAIAEDDGDLLTNSMVYLLGKPSGIKDVSWIKPGTVMLDWWGRRNFFGVDFKGGVNTSTAKYYIDFCARYNIDYFLFDYGWSGEFDLLALNPALDMDQVLQYSRAKGVAVMLWVAWSNLENQWEKAFDLFSKWGIAGIKIDYMNRDDQQMVNFYHRVAREAAARKLVVNFHGAYKPEGLHRTYPNVLTREGLIEFEFNGVNDWDSPDYHTILPFVRMVAGPADYLPGTVNNAQKHEFRPVLDRPMGQGTRAHSIALSVIIESPMRMIPDSPVDYEREDECTRFMASIPVEWDEIRVLRAKVGECVAIARRHGKDWHIGAITNWSPRDLVLTMDFLEDGKIYSVEYIEDGINADLRAIDYRKVRGTVKKGDLLNVHLAPGGGWVGRIF